MRKDIYFFVLLFGLACCDGPASKLKQLQQQCAQLQTRFHRSDCFDKRDSVWLLDWQQQFQKATATATGLDTIGFTLKQHQCLLLCKAQLKQSKHYALVSQQHPLAYDPAPVMRQLMQKKTTRDTTVCMEIMAALPQSLENAKHILQDKLEPELTLDARETLLSTQLWLDRDLPQYFSEKDKATITKAALAWRDYVGWCNALAYKKLRIRNN